MMKIMTGINRAFAALLWLVRTGLEADSPMRNHLRLPLVLVFISVAVPVHAEQLQFVVALGKPNQVKFTSSAPLETIVGVTDQISGMLAFDPDDLTAAASGRLTVGMADLDTDNRIRNGHMRKNHLHTDRFPTSEFVLKSIGEAPEGKLAPLETVVFAIRGEFTLHGITRAIEPEVTAVWNPAGQSLRVTAKFDVLLADYDIPRPQFLIMKLDERQQVEVNFIAVAR